MEEHTVINKFPYSKNIGKLDPKTVSCHFIIQLYKGYRFYCPNKHMKFIETRHAILLEDEMVRGGMVAREIKLEEMRVHVPTLMIQEPFFLDTRCCCTDNAGHCGYSTCC